MRLAPGFPEAEFNLATARATVFYDPGRLSRADLVRAIREAGYGVAAAHSAILRAAVSAVGPRVPAGTFIAKYTAGSRVAAAWRAVVLEVTDKETRQSTRYEMAIGSTVPLGDTGLTVAVLAALNIADECFRLRREVVTLQQRASDLATQLTALVDE